MNNIPYKKYITTIGILCVFSIGIWFIGPTIMLGDLTPLQQKEERIYAIVLLFLIWLLKIIFFEPDSLQQATDDPETNKKIKSLEGRIEGAIQFLKKTVITKQGKNVYLHQLPWYLLIGPTQSGKTTLLANTDINFILSKQLKPSLVQSLPASEHCDWWVTRDLTMIDIPSQYIQADAFLWKVLLNLIAKHRKQQAIQGIILTLPLPELMESYHPQKIIDMSQHLLQRILEVQQQFNLTIPLYLIITKCDRLPGFIEFFKDSGSDELAQAWGITLPALKEHEKLLDVFHNRFNLLIRRLNKQLIWRLHQERNPVARPYIKDFPLQVERLKEILLLLIKNFSTHLPNPLIKGIYLTSAIQPLGKEEDYRTAYLMPSVTDTTLQVFKNPETLSLPYFIKQIISQGLPHTVTHRAHLAPRKKVRKSIYLLSLGLIATAAIILGKDFRENVQRSHTIRNQLAEYQTLLQIPNATDRLLKSTQVIAALQQTSANPQPTILPRFFSFYTQKLLKTAQQAHQQALYNIILSGIKNYFEAYLQTQQEKNPEQIYAILKAYLMLGNPQHKQDEFILYTLHETLFNTLNEKIKISLTNNIKTALALNVTLPLNDSLIEQTRKTLNNLPSNELSYVILKNIHDNNLTINMNLGINIGTPPALISQALDSTIPRLFTARTFSTILSHDIQ